jgi:hypothetical protein
MEKDIEQYLRKRVKDIGGLCLKLECPGYTGVPDRMILLPGGHVLFAELKAPGKRERPRQELVHRIFRGLGLTVYNTVDSREKVQGIIEDCLEVMGHAV